MPPRLPAPFVCTRCLQRRAYSSTSAAPPSPPASGAAKLTSRRLLALHGPDTTQFLHGITTANIRSGQTTGFYSAFLNATGRVLNDVFIYPVGHSQKYLSSLPQKLAETQANAPAYFVEVDAEEVDKLAKHLKRYKLRAKVDIRVLEDDEWNTWSIWNESEPWTAHPSAAPSRESSSLSSPTLSGGAGGSGDDSIGCVDARAPGMGRRLVLPRSDDGQAEAVTQVGETTLGAYTVRRMLRGVAEGQHEIPREAALPQESNIDFMGGIDFKKGCYVGQELTIRTHHTGVVRKRILPVALYGPESTKPEKLQYDPNSKWPALESGVNILPVNKTGRSAGKWVTGVANIGLGMCRIELMTDMVLTGEGSRWSEEHEFKLKLEDVPDEVRIKAFVPDWHRSKTKIRNPQQRV